MRKAFTELDTGDKKLVLCEIGSCPYGNGDGKFNKLDDQKKYTICKTKGKILDIPYFC